MGQSSQNTQSTQQSSTTPWATGQGIVNNISGQLNPLIANSGLTSPQQTAINQLTANGQAGNPYAGAVGGATNNLLAGGGATNQAGMVNNAYQQYQNELNPIASNTNYNPMSTPGFSDAINQIGSDVTNQVNSQFAGAGRLGSPDNTQALARGIAAGEAPVIASQYNANVANQTGAAGSLYGAGNTTANTLSGQTQQGVANQEAGIGAAPQALTAANWGPTATIAAQELGQSIPSQNLGLLAQMGIPIAGLGTNSTGSGTSNTTSDPSLLSELTSIGGLFSAPGGTNGGAAGTSAIGGLMSLLSDRRLKEDIERVGMLFDGTPVYRYRYLGQNAFQIGLMAQDVEKYAPEAVTETAGGFKAVEYKAATEKAVHCLDWGC